MGVVWHGSSSSSARQAEIKGAAIAVLTSIGRWVGLLGMQQGQLRQKGAPCNRPDPSSSSNATGARMQRKREEDEEEGRGGDREEEKESKERRKENDRIN